MKFLSDGFLLVQIRNPRKERHIFKEFLLNVKVIVKVIITLTEIVSDMSPKLQT